MADKKKGAKQGSAKNVKKGVPATELRDLDMLDSKTAKVKGGKAIREIRKRT
jgi:hypothetical protein